MVIGDKMDKTKQRIIDEAMRVVERRLRHAGVNTNEERLMKKVTVELTGRRMVVM